jgi:hypothetical protein
MAVIRFELDLSELDDAAYGLGGPSGRSFILDTSQLDGTDVLDGSLFLVVGTASSSLGGLNASASGTVIVVTVTGVATANLGGLVATATTKTAKSAIASANLGGLVASATTKTAKSGIAVANFGGLVASATTKTSKFATATSDLGGLVASASAVVTPPGPGPEPEPTPSGGRRVYSTYPRKKIEPLPQFEIPVIQPKRRYAVASATLNGMTCTATSLITFSILDDDAEILLLV